MLLKKDRVNVECYNDIDGTVANLFRVLQDRGKKHRLQHMLRFTPFSRYEFELSYQKTSDPVEAARRLIVRTFFAFGSAGYTNQATGFRSFEKRSNSPSPAMRWRSYPDVLDFYSDRMMGVYVESRPATNIIEKFDTEETLFYLDPPYVHGTRHAKEKTSARGYHYEMTDADHIELLDLCMGVDGKVMISGYESTLYDKILKGWRRIEKNARAAGHRGAAKRTEVLWMNFELKKSKKEACLFDVALA